MDSHSCSHKREQICQREQQTNRVLSIWLRKEPLQGILRGLLGKRLAWCLTERAIE